MCYTHPRPNSTGSLQALMGRSTHKDLTIAKNNGLCGQRSHLQGVRGLQGKSRKNERIEKQNAPKCQSTDFQTS
jgi:hypothetical protein